MQLMSDSAEVHRILPCLTELCRVTSKRVGFCHHKQAKVRNSRGRGPPREMWSWHLGWLVLLPLLMHSPLAERMSLTSLKEQLAAMQPMDPSQCDFDRTCGWVWNGTFKVMKAPISNEMAPENDASNRRKGKFLWMSGPAEGQLRSGFISHTRSRCYLELALYQVEMKHGLISLIIETLNRTSYVGNERSGNNLATWETTKFNLGRITQDFRIILEMVVPFANSSIGVDNIRLIDCLPDTGTFIQGECTSSMFRCTNGECLKRDHVCDLTADCADGEDEAYECDKVPEYAKCDFENGWCGWSNERNRPINWTLHHGPTPTERMEPNADHTYRNASGTYAYVDMSRRVDYGSQGTINSPIFNRAPPYHSDPQSPYYKSCKVRFFYHQYGTHTVALGLYLIQLKPHQNHSERIWWSFKDKSSTWNSQVVPLHDIQYKYFLQFEARKSYTPMGGVAIDDVSLSPECFGVGVPSEIVGDYNYYDRKIPPWGLIPPKHPDFINETVIEVNTCGQTGRIGPTVEQCNEYHNETEVEMLTDLSLDLGDAGLRFKGIQRWIVPSGGYYTIIAMGARGGTGALTMGITLGTMVRGVVELEKGQQLYFMVGQPGTDACPKTLGSKNDTCQQTTSFNSSYEYFSIVRQVKNIELKDGAGGGGGATYIFTLKSNGEQQPLIIAAGGGGLGPTQFHDDGVQHGKGALPFDRTPINGVSFKKNAGGGGGWLPSSNNDSNPVANGMALTKGGIGGVGCGTNHKGHGDGGFGGGGGGCLSGGGGGGYAGGGTGHVESGNGEGGYSYAASELLHVSYLEKSNPGSGEVFIIPAVSGCGCNFRCVVVDQHLSETRCLCPPGWQLSNDSKSCIMSSESDVTHQTFMIILIIVSISLVIAFSGLCLLLYNRYLNRKALLRRRQVMFGNGTELTALRVVSDNIMTEFNPNYEFAGNLYSFKDLPQIPRDNIDLVKPLGQGAFGEVFQGIYKYRRNEEHPVAVKTLPSLSTSQAEADFMMEALIMSKFNHPNIVHFIGVSFDKHPRYIVLELLAGGDLKNFLREERPRPDRPTSLTMQNLIMCAFDVAKGCKYMEDARFIHRDIAARNCLLTSKDPARVVKIADFGMARDIYRSDYYRKGGKAMLPIKWMPPESFLDGIFTTKTDVWAFGVLLWEIMSFGYMPYTGCANREVMSMVTSGGRLERPAGCPDPIYGVMTRCWHPHPEERPSFTTIVERIGYCLQDPDVINHPTPNYDLLPICEREITIMRPDPETECINMHADLDGGAYMQPRLHFRPATYRIGQPPGIVYASLKHEDQENRNNFPKDSKCGSEDSSTREHFHKHRGSSEEHDPDDICKNSPDKSPPNTEDESRTNKVVDSSSTNQGSTTTCNIDSIDENENTEQKSSSTDINKVESYDQKSETVSSSPNTRTNSPSHGPADAVSGCGNKSPSNINGIVKKNTLKAALSLDPSALCRGNVPYEKIAFSTPKPKLNNPEGADIRKDSLSHELPREEECSC